MKRANLVMIGNGMAGCRTLEELLAIAPGLYDITVFGSEPHPNYNRILLSPLLAGEMTLQDIVLNDFDWYRENGVTLHAGKRIVRIDRIGRKVLAEDGTQAPYDRLLLATGSQPFILPVPGCGLPGVIAYRDIADTEAMIDAAQRHQHAVVIGAGLLGLEAANGLALRGMDVTIVHLMPWIMERQLDRVAAAMLQRSLEAKGLKFLLPKQTQEIVADAAGRVAAVRLADGEEIPAELVVMTAGIRPNAELARAAGLHCNRGVVVNDTMQTFDPRIYAVGECAEHRGTAYGLVAPLFEQAKVCATHLAHFGIGRYSGSVLATKLKVTGIDVFSAGEFAGGEGVEEITLNDPCAGVYKKLVVKDRRILGAVLYGDTVDSSWYLQLMRDRQDVHEIRDHLLFGRTHLGDAGHQGASRAGAMPEHEQICGCNGVSKGAIVKAIKEKGLFTLEDVRKHTKASSSCGSCTGLVEQLLASTIGGAYRPANGNDRPVCGCTELSHGAVRLALRENKWLDIPTVMRALQWRTPNGCATCRPALNYYLVSTWPHEAQDDPQSRFINERAHANIQKDGTYSVVPRMWGGVTTPKELRAIADVAEKYAVPTVKVTGGQRIDLLGVRKEDLPKIWAELGEAGLVSGHAYGKSLRTVKTCVGAEHCRFGTQSSMSMGAELERMLFGMWSPHKVKLAVSGCPRNCAEAGLKDVGVIGLEGAWEIYVAGNGGIKTEVAQFLCKVATREEVLEHSAAFLQLYREEGYYLERTVHFVARVGLDYVRKQVVDDAAGRKTLAQRLVFALADYVDPWAQRAAADDPKALRREFEPLVAQPLSAEPMAHD
jgi:nitrite reductase (NADH) large subunit